MKILEHKRGDTRLDLPQTTILLIIETASLLAHLPAFCLGLHSRQTPKNTKQIKFIFSFNFFSPFFCAMSLNTMLWWHEKLLFILGCAWRWSSQPVIMIIERRMNARWSWMRQVWVPQKQGAKVIPVKIFNFQNGAKFRPRKRSHQAFSCVMLISAAVGSNKSFTITACYSPSTHVNLIKRSIL